MSTVKTKKGRTSLKTTGLKVPGFRASGIACGIKKGRKKDLALILSDVPATVAGVFTTNRVKAAPVLLDMKRVLKGALRGVVINSGNANACTGKEGYRASERTASLVEEALGLKKGEILVCSTGVIGVRLPMESIESGVPRLIRGLDYNGLHGAAGAIMTTDAFAKTCTVRGIIGGRRITVAGIAKGAGMIAPDMATMLAFFVTDANIAARPLARALREATFKTFNSIMVDNDTSTNDTALIFANAASGLREIKGPGPELTAFSKLLTDAARELSKMIVKDGEGATRFVEIEIRGAKSQKDARLGAKTVAGSMLVKTALFGGDPNWGRIMAAIGRAGIRLNPDRVAIALNGVSVVRGGLDTGNEKRAARAMKKKEITVVIDLNLGPAGARFWTTDLGYDYIRINSSYRT